MQRFHFSLEALLRMRKREEDEKKKKLGEASRVFSLAEKELQQTGAEYDACQERETLVRTEGETVQHMRLYIQYIFDLKIRIERQKQQLLEAGRKVQEARQELMEARRRLKAIENLRDKKQEVWKKERSRFEVKLLDDLCSQQFVRLNPAEAVAERLLEEQARQ